MNACCTASSGSLQSCRAYNTSFAACCVNNGPTICAGLLLARDCLVSVGPKIGPLPCHAAWLDYWYVAAQGRLFRLAIMFLVIWHNYINYFSTQVMPLAALLRWFLQQIDFVSLLVGTLSCRIIPPLTQFTPPNHA